MKTKTIKTPSVGLILFQSLCAQCYDSVFKSAKRKDISRGVFQVFVNIRNLYY